MKSIDAPLHKYVRTAFEKIKGPNGNTITLFPVTCLSYASLMIDSCLRNKSHLEEIIDSDNWNSNTSSVSISLTTSFEDDIRCNPWRKLSALSDILRPLSQSIHDMERRGARASWIYTLCSSLVVYSGEWAGKKKTTDYLDESKTVSSRCYHRTLDWC